MGKKIGIFGGSFNPIHSGHAMIINYLSQNAGFDKILIMVANLNPFKDKEELASNHHRLAMARLVADRFDNVEASDIEFNLPLPSYTINTLVYLKKLNPFDDFHIIIGGDNWQSYTRWKDHDKLMNDFNTLVYNRPGYSIELPVTPNVSIIDNVPSLDISSTFVRKEIAKGNNINFLVPCCVADYIANNNLYK